MASQAFKSRAQGQGEYKFPNLSPLRNGRFQGRSGKVANRKPSFDWPVQLAIHQESEAILDHPLKVHNLLYQTRGDPTTCLETFASPLLYPILQFEIVPIRLRVDRG